MPATANGGVSGPETPGHSIGCGNGRYPRRYIFAKNIWLQSLSVMTDQSG